MQKKVKRADSRAASIAAGRRRAGWMPAITGIAAIAIAAGAGLLPGHAQSSPEQDFIELPQPLTIPIVPAGQQPTVTLGATKPAAVAEQRRTPVAQVKQVSLGSAVQATQASSDSTMEAKQAAGESPANAKQDAAGEAADLLKMATALKAEVDKSTKDTLSVTVVRRAGEIEQLAHKARMGLGPGKS